MNLSELIQECNGDNGQRFRWLKNCKTHWLAQARPEHPKSAKYPDAQDFLIGKDIKAEGKTPEEAVTNLLEKLSKNTL